MFVFAYEQSDRGDYSGDYSRYRQDLAYLADTMDWAVDASTSLDQHIDFNCRFTPRDSTYDAYAEALIHPLAVTEAVATGQCSPGTVSVIGCTRNAVFAQYGRSSSPGVYNGHRDRWYVILTDYNSTGSIADVCRDLAQRSEPGKEECASISQFWRLGIVLHEMVHTFGAGHSWRGQNATTRTTDDGPDPDSQRDPVLDPDGTYHYDYGLFDNHDVMGSWPSAWKIGTHQSFDLNYDPFNSQHGTYNDPYIDSSPVTAGGPSPAQSTPWNIVNSPPLTSPTCCDNGLNTLVPTLKRNAEGTASDFSAWGGTANRAVDAYYHGRHSLRMDLDGTAANGGISTGDIALKNPAGTSYASGEYRFHACVSSFSATPPTLRLEARWKNATGGVIRTDSAPTTVTPPLKDAQDAWAPVSPIWLCNYFTATQPSGATVVILRVVTTQASSAGFNVDSLSVSRVTGNQAGPTG